MTAVLGIAGWKNSGKTTLTIRLVSERTSHGYVVSTIKHAHHEADVDHEGAVSFRHRLAGAAEVALVTANRWALMHELMGAAEPSLADILARMSPVDLVVVEGFKREPIPKLDVRRREAADHTPLIADPNVIATAGDVMSESDKPHFDLDDLAGIAAFVISHFRLDAAGDGKGRGQ